MLRVCCLQLQESCLTYSHSISSQLDSSPESSEAGADVLLARSGETRGGETRGGVSVHSPR